MMRTGLLLLAACALPSPAAAQRFLGKSDDQWVADLEHNDTKVRRSAAHALGKIGRAASPSLRALVTSLGDQEAAVRDTAAFALGEIALKQEGNPELVRSQASDKLQERLGDADARVRRSAAYALGSSGALSCTVY